MRALLAVAMSVIVSGCASIGAKEPEEQKISLDFTRPMYIDSRDIDRYTCRTGVPLTCKSATRARFLCSC